MADLQEISVIDSIKGRIDQGLEVTSNEVDFAEAFEINNAVKNGQPVSEEEIGKAESFADLFNLVGTDDENQLRETLKQSGAPFEIMKAQAPSKDSLARIAGRNEGAGLLDQDSRSNFFQAIQSIKSGISGDLDFESAVTEFERLQSETAAKREAIKAENPEAFEQSRLATEISTAIAGGGAAQKSIGSMLTAIPKVGASPLLTGVAETAAGGAGAVASELITNKDFDAIAEAGLTGAALDAVLRGAGPVARLGSKKLSEFLQKTQEKSLDSAARMAVRAVAPIKRPLIRALERGKGGIEAVGRALLQEKVIPPFPPFFLPSSIDKRLLKARKRAGEALGSVRKEAEDFNDSFMKKLRSEAEVSGNPENASEVLSSIDDIERKLRFDPARVADRLQEYVDSIDPLARSSERGGVVKRIQKNIDEFRADPNPRSISSAIKLKELFRSQIQKKGALSPAITVEADGIVNRIIADEVDQAITKSLSIKKRLGTDFNSQNVEVEFGKLATDLERGIKALEKGGATPEEIQHVVDTMASLDDMGSVFRSIAKSGDLLLEKNLSTQTNNIVSLRDSLAASAGFQTLGSPEAAVGGAVLSNFLRSRGSATGAKGMEFMSNRVKDLEMSVGSFTGGIKLMSDMKTLTPAMYLAITRPDSPLNVHNFMVIDDAEFLEEFKARISDDEDISSVRKASLISEINSKGEVRIFKKGSKDENTVADSPGLEGFRKRLENFIPHNPSPLAPPGATDAFDFSQSPLFGKKKLGEPVPSGRPTGNLPMNKQIQGFLDTIMGTTQIGIDPQETFPESQISPEELELMNAQAGVPPGGKLFSLDKRRRSKAFEESEKKIEGIIEDLGGKFNVKTSSKEFNQFLKDRFTTEGKRLSSEELAEVKKLVTRIMELESKVDVDPARVPMVLKALKKLGVTEKPGVKEARRKIDLEKLAKEQLGGENKTLKEFNKIVDQHNGEYKSIRKSGEEFLIELSDGGRFPDGRKSKRFGSLDEAKNFVIFENRGLGKESRDEILDELKDFRRKRGNVSIVDDASMKKEAEALFRKLLKLTPGTPEYKRILEQLDTIGAIPK